MSNTFRVTLDPTDLVKLGESLGKKPAEIGRAIFSGIKGAAYYFQQALKNAVKKNRFGWAPLRKYHSERATVASLMALNPPEAGKTIVSRKGKKKGRAGNISNMFRYDADLATLSAEIGVLPKFFGQKGVQYFRGFTGGGTFTVDPKMRRYWAALGMPLKQDTGTLYSPMRKLLEPLWTAEYKNIEKVMFVDFQRKIGQL